MDCREFEDNLSAYLDTELGDDARNLFEQHRRDCTLCDMLLEGVSSNIILLGHLSEVEPPPELAARILAATRPRRSLGELLSSLFTFRPLTMIPRTAGAWLLSLFLAAVTVNFFLPAKPGATSDVRAQEPFLLAGDAVNSAFNTTIKVYRGVSDAWDTVTDTAGQVGGFFQTKWEQVKDVFRTPEKKTPERKDDRKKNDRNGENYGVPGDRTA